ncbi:hypothetical protein DB347_17550 [Opitutaceae bacterium EW11]|nr:hypothetical protein DB347_17550 [Opitutaceae bacterium EW11]
MTQGGAVVSDVAQFLVKAREELSAFQSEQERYASAQAQLLQEKQALSDRLAEMQRAVDLAALRAAEQEVLVSGLNSELAERKREGERIKSETVSEECRTLEAKLSVADAEVARLTAELESERKARENTVGEARKEEASHYGREIVLLKERLTALEKQLDAERQRRSRLMEVVRTPDVLVNSLTRESA